MSAHLLAIAIGPVQDFIAAGRKTRDLWFGSCLLGEVSRQVAKAVRRSGGTLIFPDESAVVARLPVANKVLAWVEPGIDPRVLAEVARRRAQVQLAWYRRQTLRSLPSDVRRRVREPLMADQLANFLEFAAAWYPVEETTYQWARGEVELLLAGRKALREFAPAHGLDGVPKSSLDPARESVIDWPEDAGQAERVRRRLRLKGAEQLDGVSLVKRLAEPRRFVSVARVAVDPFIRRARKEALDGLAALAARARAMADADHPSLEPFAATTEAGLAQYAAFPFDTQLFYDDGRGDPDLRQQAGPNPVRDREREQAREFFKAASDLRLGLKIPEMPTYFAVLVADGDHMGRAISVMDDHRDHRRLSERLASFAGKADTIVQAHQGAMVYSGGDDVLAFLPLDRALACADALRHEFTATMAGATGETAVSLSVGVAIGHYGEHLQRLLAWGREAEGKAKAPRDEQRPNETSRNALAVSLHTRGAGEGRTVVHGWEERPVTGRWHRWVAWHRCDLIPDSAAYELSRIEQEFRRLWPDPDDKGAAATERRERLGDLLRREVVRVLGRRRAGHGGAAFDEERQRTLLKLVGTDLDALRRVADELLIARRIAVAADVAEGKPDAETCRGWAERERAEAERDDSQ